MGGRLGLGMTMQWISRLTERQRIGVMLMEPTLQSRILDRYPPESYTIDECRWAAQAIADIWPLASPVAVARRLMKTREGELTRWDFVGAEWLLQTAKRVPDWCNQYMLEAARNSA